MKYVISIKYSKVILTWCIFFSLEIRFKQHNITIKKKMFILLVIIIKTKHILI